MATESKSLPRILTAKQLAEYLQVHPMTIYKLVQRRDLPAFKLGGDWRFTAEAVEQWLSQRR